MTPSKKASMIELHWKDVRIDFAKKNPELAKIIDEIDPGDEYTLFRASYPFGSYILKNAGLLVPTSKGELVSLTNSEISKNIQEKLGYNINSNPVCMILNHTAELFIISEDHTIPLYGLIHPGKIFGTWRILNPATHNPIFIWDMTAGARSLFMLPKISETIGYNNLRREFHLNNNKPKKLIDHWKIFEEIANHSAFGEKWSVEILFFSKQWFERLNDKKWLKFKVYLLEQAWDGSEYFRNQFMWDLAFSLIQKKYEIKPTPYIANNVKYLLGVGTGALPAFLPAINDEAAPIHRLQEIFSSIYNLKEYSPIIMQPGFFSLESARPVYYSLQYPTTIEFSAKSRENTTKLFDLYQIKSLLNRYLSAIQTDSLNLSGTPIYTLTENIKYDFFHTNIENHSGLRLSKEIPNEDASFTKMSKNFSKNFPYNSSFMRGCIRITKKSKSVDD